MKAEIRVFYDEDKDVFNLSLDIEDPKKCFILTRNFAVELNQKLNNAVKWMNHKKRVMGETNQINPEMVKGRCPCWMEPIVPNLDGIAHKIQEIFDNPKFHKAYHKAMQKATDKIVEDARKEDTIPTHDVFTHISPGYFVRFCPDQPGLTITDVDPESSFRKQVKLGDHVIGIIDMWCPDGFMWVV